MFGPVSDSEKEADQKEDDASENVTERNWLVFVYIKDSRILIVVIVLRKMKQDKREGL